MSRTPSPHPHAIAEAIRQTIEATGWQDAGTIIDLTVERTGYPERDVRRVWDRQFAIKDAC